MIATNPRWPRKRIKAELDARGAGVGARTTNEAMLDGLLELKLWVGQYADHLELECADVLKKSERRALTWLESQRTRIEAAPIDRDLREVLIAGLTGVLQTGLIEHKQTVDAWRRVVVPDILDSLLWAMNRAVPADVRRVLTSKRSVGAEAAQEAIIGPGGRQYEGRYDATKPDLFRQPLDPDLVDEVLERPDSEGQRFDDWYHTVNLDQARRIRREVGTALADPYAQPFSELRRAVNRTIFTGTWATLNWSGVVAHSAIQTAAIGLQEETYRANSDVVAGEQWMTALDDRVCDRCGPLDRSVWYAETDPRSPKVSERPRIPLHPRDRCEIAPWTYSLSEMGIAGAPELGAGSRASMTGDVPGATSFGQWVRKQTAATQRRIVGPSRYEMLEKGEIKYGDLAAFGDRKKHGRIEVERRTLPELRALIAGDKAQALPDLTKHLDIGGTPLPTARKKATSQ